MAESRSSQGQLLMCYLMNPKNVVAKYRPDSVWELLYALAGPDHSDLRGRRADRDLSNPSRAVSQKAHRSGAAGYARSADPPGGRMSKTLGRSDR